MIKFRLKEEPPSLDDKEIIKNVKSNQFLYDTHHPDYRKLPLRDAVWTSISTNMNIRDSKHIHNYLHFDHSPAD